MSALISNEMPGQALPSWAGASLDQGGSSVEPQAGSLERIGPNAFVRWSFYLAAFSIPFVRLYIPGTGDRLGVIRIVQLLFLCAVLLQPRVCLRWLPTALLWFGGYCALRILGGLWLSPHLIASWWPTTLDWLQFFLPSAWIMFNLLQFPGIGRKGLWAFAWGCAFCASLHIAGIGVTAVDNDIQEVRTTIFGENANLVGATYAAGVIALIGLGMFKGAKLSHRLLHFSLIALIGLGLAKTGSRSALLLVLMGLLVLGLQAKSFSSRTRRYTALLFVGVIFALIIRQVPTVMERFMDLDTSDIGHENPRARMAPVLWEIFLRSPIYGSGPDQYQFELTRRAMPYLIRDQRTIAAHNLVLLQLVETGIIGFLIFGTGLWMALTSAWRARVNACGLLPFALLLPFFVSGIFLANPTSGQIFWFAVAYALAGAG